MIHTVEAEAATFSQLDSERFGIRAARAHIVPGNLQRVLDFCAAENIDLLIARCTTSDLAVAQQVEAQGFRLTDTLLYYGFDLTRKAIPEHSSEFVVRPLQPNDRNEIRHVATSAFQGYLGHYHADPRLDRRKCDEIYASWAERSTTLKSAADQVRVVEHRGKLAGFGTLRKNSAEEVEGLLFAISPEYQKRGACRALMIDCLHWCRLQQAQHMVISTQVTNTSMQKVWCRVGFEPTHSYYTFHKWFD